MKRAAAMLGLSLLGAAPAAGAPCPLAGEVAMLTVRLYFGQKDGATPISGAAWRDFVARTVTPDFPSGFTVYDAMGQWRDGRTGTIIREASKVIEIDAPDTPALRRRVGDIRRIYAARFHQQSVGLLTHTACGTF